MKQANTSVKLLERENQGLKDTVVHLEVVLTRKEVELEKITKRLQEAEIFMAKWNSRSTKLSEVIELGNDGTTGLGFQSTESTIDQKEKDKDFEFLKDAPKFVKEKASGKKVLACQFCLKTGHKKTFLLSLQKIFNESF